jgi:hypothetical protein
VHPVDVPFTDAIRVISRWGSGAKNLVAAMERRESVAPTAPMIRGGAAVAARVES